MAVVVHLFDARHEASIRRSGVRGKETVVTTPTARITLRRGVFVTPVLPNYFVSHQWLRELKRRGMRTIRAANIRMRSDAMVWVGHFSMEHRYVPLGHAIGLFMSESDPRGWEIVVPGPIEAKAITSVRDVPQVTGWRYFPTAHEKGPWKCLCDGCLRGLRGDIKSRGFVRRLVKREGAEALNCEGPPPRPKRTKR
jgi:hypothetical protein